MKTVRVVNCVVHEIIPEYALPVETWYGPTFAVQCHEAPDEVEQGWVYDEIAGTFAPPAEPEPVTPTMTTEEATLDMLADIDYRLGLIELGVQTKEVTL